MQHLFVESYSAFQRAREAIKANDEAVWYTTSPYLIRMLPKNGEEVECPERRIKREEMQGLAKAAYDIAESYFDRLNKICSWRNFADLKLIFSGTFRRCFFVTFYKALLLHLSLDEVKRRGGNKLICVGDPKQITFNGLDMNYGRLDTLYAYIASTSDRDDLGLFRHEISGEDLKRVERSVVYRRMSRWEKFLSLINNTPSSFLYKFVKQMNMKGWYPFKNVSIRMKPEKTFYIYKDCELIAETFLGIILKGGRISWIGELPNLDHSVESCESLPQSRVMENELKNCISRIFEKRGLAFYPLYKTAQEIVIKRTFTVIERLRSNLKKLTEKYHAFVSNWERNATILTNSLTQPMERLFYCYCRKKGIRVAAFEHGITLGLSAESKWFARDNGMLAADVGFYHNREAMKTVAPYANDQKMVLAGLPRVTKRVFFSRLQRILVRRWLHIGRHEHVVMFPVNLEINNFIYGPYDENDFNYLESTIHIYEAILKGFPSSRCILKLYPSQRYLESYDFTDIFNRYNNVQIVKDMDFRFIRAAADLLVLTSPQSTLGWVLGTGKPVIFAELNWIPVLFDGFEMPCKDIPEVKKFIFLKPNHSIIEQGNLKKIYSELFR
ncbi:MAG: hypothetical protein JRJ62_13705 [Deltaproteobacteria bacterium]|nr:hypothetical protein [Deltaproteobacteria bacterium]